MKEYSVSFSEPVEYKYIDRRYNYEKDEWVEKEVVEMKSHYTFYSLAPAKRLIKQHLDKYTGSSIVKIWSNGDWENCGEIKLSGSNKHFIANTRMTQANY